MPIQIPLSSSANPVSVVSPVVFPQDPPARNSNKQQSTALNHVMIVLSDGDSVFNRCDPLGARCVMGALEHIGHDFTGLFQDRLESRATIIHNASQLNPSVIWISVQPDTKGIGRFVQNLSRRTSSPIVLGNVGARFLTREDFPGVSNPVMVVLGQGEDAATLLARFFEKPQDKRDYTRLRQVPNLRWFGADGTVETESRPSELAKSVVPSPSFLEEAVARDDLMSARSSSGCDASCVFCTVRAINNGQGWQESSTPALRQWLEHMVQAGKAQGKVALVDDDLAGSLSNLAAVATAFARVNH